MRKKIESIDKRWKVDIYEKSIEFCNVIKDRELLKFDKIPINRIKNIFVSFISPKLSNCKCENHVLFKLMLYSGEEISFVAYKNLDNKDKLIELINFLKNNNVIFNDRYDLLNIITDKNSDINKELYSIDINH